MVRQLQRRARMQMLLLRIVLIDDDVIRLLRRTAFQKLKAGHAIQHRKVDTLNRFEAPAK